MDSVMKSIKLKLIQNKANKQVTMHLPKKEIPKSIRDKLWKYKEAKIFFEGFE